MRRRKIVQICVSPENDLLYVTICALCNDGTLWRQTHAPPDKRKWVLLDTKEITETVILIEEEKK